MPGPLSGREELHVFDSTATCLVHQAREDLPTDTSAACVFGEDHLAPRR